RSARPRNAKPLACRRQAGCAPRRWPPTTNPKPHRTDMNQYPQIASRVLNTPLLLEPGYARVFFSALASRLGIAQLQDAEGEVLTGQKMRMNAASFSGDRERERPYQVVDGVA